MAQTTSDSILGVIRQEFWILNHWNFRYHCVKGGIREPLAKRIWWRHLANNIALAEVPAVYDCCFSYNMPFTQSLLISESIAYRTHYSAWSAVCRKRIRGAADVAKNLANMYHYLISYWYIHRGKEVVFHTIIYSLSRWRSGYKF